MLSSLFDEYSLNARVRPALLALLPTTVFVYLEFPQLYSVLAGAISVFMIFGLVTALAHFCRSAGRSAEKKLYLKWGGKPTTMMLRQSNDQIDPITKLRYYEFLSSNIKGWVAPSVDEEMREPHKADQVYSSAVLWLLEYTRDKKLHDILFKENISYGFRRNCYGIKWLAAILALIPIFIVIADFIMKNISIINFNELTWVSMCLSLCLFCWWVFIVSEKWVKDAATAYATRLLAACETKNI